MTYQLRDYQSYAVDSCVNFIKYCAGVSGFGVAPGGSGKSIIIAKIAESAVNLDKRVIVLARSEKLLRQNKEKIAPEIHPRVGIYCASIGERDFDKDITIASIQSIANLQETLKPDLILVDECHEIHPDSDGETQYWEFFRKCGNPQIIGLTATDFRTASGKIAWGEEIFKIPLKPLIEQGYLCPPTNKAPVTPDLSEVDIRIGEYVENQLEDVFLDADLLRLSIKALIEYGADRNHALVFCQSRKHARIINQTLIENGQNSVYVDGDTPKTGENNLDDIINSKPKFICNNNLMTTGYDMPWLDMIAILRSTLSKGLFEQMLYRGTRLYSGKKDFLALDMGGNFVAHGALGSPYTGKATKSERAKPQGRICPECETFAPLLSKECPDCGYQFPEPEPAKVDHNRKPDFSSGVVYDENTPPETYTVNKVEYYSKKSKKDNVMIVVNYHVAESYEPVTEYFLPYHDSDWVRGRCHKFITETGHILGSNVNEYSIEDLLWHCAQRNKTPTKIIRSYNKKGYADIKRIYETEKQSGGRDSKSAGTLAEQLDDEIPF